MNHELYFAFVAAAALLLIAPGPNVSLTIANGVSGGVRSGLLTVAGSSSAIVLQLIVMCVGVTSLMLALAAWIEGLRWLGVAYLIYLGVQYWRRVPEKADLPGSSNGGGRRSYWQGFVISATNPKLLFFYAAFFPQFVDPAFSPGPQLVLLSATFFTMAVCVDSTYALLAGRARPLLAGNRAQKLGRRFTGTMLISAGVGLVLARTS